MLSYFVRVYQCYHFHSHEVILYMHMDPTDLYSLYIAPVHGMWDPWVAFTLVMCSAVGDNH